MMDDGKGNGVHTFIQTINYGRQKITGADGLKRVDNSELKDIEIANPSEHGGTALTVICGRNRTGKSHVLRHTYQALRAYNSSFGKPDFEVELGAASANVWVRPEDSTKLFAPHLLLTNLSETAKRFSTLPALKQVAEKGNNELHISAVRWLFVHDQLLTAPSLAQAAGRAILEADLQENSLRSLFGFFKPDKLYLVDTSACEPLRAFERMCNGKLYLRPNINFGFEPVLRFSREEFVTFGSNGSGWSQGQKVAFVLLLILHYLRPSILLIDELENHLHPEFISGLCELIKSHVSQTIVTTHHPHLIFSTYVDRAWFLEVVNTEDKPNLIEDIPKNVPENRAPPDRRLIDLTSDFQRVAAAYQLFDSMDRQLLNLGLSARSELAFHLLDAINGALTLKVVSARAGGRSDGQTNALAEVITDVAGRQSTKVLRVLDYGAGTGRTFWELAKVKKFDLTNLRWTFFEPDIRNSEKLMAQLSQRSDLIGVEVQTIRDTITSHFDIILAVNLLHECTPRDIYRFFNDCRKSLASDGKIIIAELYPLLEPERFGIGYSSADMVEIANACGFMGYSSSIPMRGGSLTAYAFVANPVREVQEADAVQTITSEIWSSIKRRHLIEYGATVESRHVRDVVRLASQLHAIASMDAYAQGSWRDITPSS